MVYKYQNPVPLKKLIQWEEENGYKAKWVAQKLGLSPSQYSQIKLGKIRPSVAVVERFQKEFEIADVFDLFKEE